MRHTWLKLWGYEVNRVNRVWDISFGKPGIPYTEVYYTGSGGRTKRRYIHGHWYLEDFK